MKLVKFFFGLLAYICIGTIITITVSEDVKITELIEELWSSYRGPYIKDFSLFQRLLILLILAVVATIIINLIHFFINNSKKEKGVLLCNGIVYVLVGIPVTIILYKPVERIFNILYMVFGAIDDLYFSFVAILGIAIVFYLINSILKCVIACEFEKPQKRFGLYVCRILTDNTLLDTVMVMEKETFQTCYDGLAYNKDKVGDGQFYCIREYNWNYKKVLNEFRYYKNGDVINESDEMLRGKMDLAKYSKDISWVG